MFFSLYFVAEFLEARLRCPGSSTKGICVSVKISFVHIRSFSNYFIGPSAATVVCFSIVQGPFQVLVFKIRDNGVNIIYVKMYLKLPQKPYLQSSWQLVYLCLPSLAAMIKQLTDRLLASTRICFHCSGQSSER